MTPKESALEISRLSKRLAGSIGTASHEEARELVKTIRELLPLAEAAIPRPLESLRVGDMVTPAEMAAYFNGRAGWCGGVYVCDGAHRDGTSGFKVLEVRGFTPSWGQS